MGRQGPASCGEPAGPAGSRARRPPRRSLPHAVHRLASRHSFRPRSWPQRGVLKAIFIIWWPFRALELTVEATGKWGVVVANAHQRSRFRQVLDQLQLAITHSISPADYYRYSLYLPERRNKIEQFLFTHEVPSLFPFLNAYRDCAAVDDKREFANLCERHGVRTPELLAVAERGRVRSRAGAPVRLPAADLFIKPSRGSRGEAVSAWRFCDNRYQDQSGCVLTHDELLSRFAMLSETQPFIVQPNLRPHAALADLCNGRVPTARIVTALIAPDDVRVVVAIFRMPKGKAITTTYGLNSPIDVTTGVLGPAVRTSAVSAFLSHHPRSGAPIAGRILPRWQDGVALVRTVHPFLPECLFLGWDVAWSSDGPLLLGANRGFDVGIMQHAPNPPFGETGFAEICMAQQTAGRADGSFGTGGSA